MCRPFIITWPTTTHFDALNFFSPHFLNRPHVIIIIIIFRVQPRNQILIFKKVVDVLSTEWFITGIGPDSKYANDGGENMEQEQKGVKEALISAYDKNISSTLKDELCSLDANNFTNYAKDASSKRTLFLNHPFTKHLSFLLGFQNPYFKYLCNGPSPRLTDNVFFELSLMGFLSSF